MSSDRTELSSLQTNRPLFAFLFLSLLFTETIGAKTRDGVCATVDVRRVDGDEGAPLPAEAATPSGDERLTSLPLARNANDLPRQAERLEPGDHPGACSSAASKRRTPWNADDGNAWWLLCQSDDLKFPRTQA